MNKLLLLAGVAASLTFATTLTAQAATDTSVPPQAVKVDTNTDVTTDAKYNANGEVVATETTTTTTDVYQFDTNQNTYMDQDEYVVYSYTKIDHNGDGLVDEIEWNDYTNYWYSPLPIKHDPVKQSFVSYDLNGDGRLDRSEYEKAYDVNIYQSWDSNKDGRVDMSEYQTITKTYYDLDNDGIYEWMTIN